MPKDFYSPRQIKFTRAQCLWLIRNLSSLREGYWPTGPSSGYVELGQKKKPSKGRAYFEIPIDYAVEIETRLEKAGINGLILLGIECWEMSVPSMATYLRMSEWVIQKRKRQALAFVAGWKRKVK